MAETPKFDSHYTARLIVAGIAFVIYVVGLIRAPEMQYIVIYLSGILVINIVYHIELGWRRIEGSYNLFYETLLLAMVGLVIQFSEAEWVLVLVNTLSGMFLLFEMYRIYLAFKDQWMLDTAKWGPHEDSPVLKPLRKDWFIAHRDSFSQFSFALIIGIYLVGVFLPITGFQMESGFTATGWIFIGAMNLILVLAYALWRVKSKFLYLLIGLQFIVAGFQSWVLLLLMIAATLIQIAVLWIGVKIYSPMKETGIFHGQTMAPH